MAQKLNLSFYRQPDVLAIARNLLGKVLVTRNDGVYTSGRIAETEAYAGITDRASHAYGGRRSTRTSVMYKAGGLAYVYLCYGMHHLFNVVTHQEGTPHVVLIRAIEPLEGLTEMTNRTGKLPCNPALGAGPGNLTRSLGIGIRHNGLSLLSRELFIADDGYSVPDADIRATPRIGIDYAGEDAARPYRFIIADHPYLSATTVKTRTRPPIS